MILLRDTPSLVGMMVVSWHTLYRLFGHHTCESLLDLQDSDIYPYSCFTGPLHFLLGSISLNKHGFIEQDS